MRQDMKYQESEGGMRVTLSRLAATGLLAVSALMGMSTASAMPLAGTTIGNQAAASYTDASLTPRTATSNTVVTTVAQVAAFTLTSPQSKSAAPGSSVSFPHTITNNGNGTDSFDLTLITAAGAFTLTPRLYFADANCDGVADSATPITSVNGVSAGASACFIATGGVPVAATNATTGTMTVAASSAFTPATTQSNLDQVTVTAQAVVSVTKSISVPSGLPGTTPVTYTLTYTNTGNTAATSVILADFLPANANYIAGSAKWNGAALTDANDVGVDPTGIAYDENITTVGAVTAVLSSVAAGQSGQLTFTVTMGQATAPVTAPGAINNQARYCYNDGAADQPAGCTTVNAATSATAGTGTPTNTATFMVLQIGAVAANELAGNITTGGVTDTVTVASATQGATVSFTDYIHNIGNGTDTFNLTLSPAGNFPAGTTFLLFQSDGVTPLTDSNAIPDGVVDTGPVAAGAYYAVVVKAVLPASSSGGGAYTQLLAATSTFNPAGAGIDTVTNTLTTIAGNTVDLTTGAQVGDTATPVATAGAQGYGAGPSTASVVGGNTVNPGASVTYALFVNNTSAIADTYAVSSTALPAGWSVAYFADGGAGNCSTLGATVTNTGVINGVVGTTVAYKVVCAVVTTAATGATAAPGANNITFTATSPTTLVTDTKLETVTINTVRSISLTPPNAGQVFPGGSVVYAHILVNNGNVTEAAGGAGSEVTLTDPLSGASLFWNNVVYWDSNSSGALDASDPVVSDVALSTVAGFTSLAPGASIRLFVKVLAPASAAAGDINTSSLTATTVGVINLVAAPATVVAADTTTVIVGQVLLTKTQALDAACDGTADTLFSNAPITAATAIPGACVMYQVTAQNVGAADVTTVIVSDATPANTTYSTTPAATMTIGAAAAVAVTSAPANGAAGTISANLGTLIPGESAIIDFAIKINP